MFQGGVGLTAIEVGLEDEVVGDDIGGYSGLGDEAVEGEEIGVLGLAEESVEDRVDGVDGGAAVRVDGVAGEEGGLVEVIFADEGEDAVVEIEPVAGERRHGLRELGGVGVLRYLGLLGFWGLLGLGAVKGGERRFDAETTLAAASFRCCFFWG